MGISQIDIVNMIRNAGPVVQFVLLLLLFFSIMSWAIILIKYRYIRRAYKESAEFTDFFWKSRDLSNAFAKAKQLPGSPLARIFRIGCVYRFFLEKPGFVKCFCQSKAAPWKSRCADIQDRLCRAQKTESIYDAGQFGRGSVRRR